MPINSVDMSFDNLFANIGVFEEKKPIKWKLATEIANSSKFPAEIFEEHKVEFYSMIGSEVLRNSKFEDITREKMQSYIKRESIFLIKNIFAALICYNTLHKFEDDFLEGLLGGGKSIPDMNNRINLQDALMDNKESIIDEIGEYLPDLKATINLLFESEMSSIIEAAEQSAPNSASMHVATTSSTAPTMIISVIPPEASPEREVQNVALTSLQYTPEPVPLNFVVTPPSDQKTS